MAFIFRTVYQYIAGVDAVLLESGYNLRTEDGFFIMLEGS